MNASLPPPCFISIRTAILASRYTFTSESDLQAQLSAALTAASITHNRELHDTRASRPDFTLPDSGLRLEVKRKAIAQDKLIAQLTRYCEVPTVSGVILVSIRPHNLPATLAGKPVWNIPLWKNVL